MAEIQEEPGGPLVTATECSICDRPIPPEAAYPLCPRCLGTAEAAGQYEADARRYPDPEWRRA
jgi:hypothetical protein